MNTVSTLASRPLGKNGPLVPRIGLGLMSLSGAHGVIKPDAERLAFLDKAYDMGETFWDTGNLFPGEEQRLFAPLFTNIVLSS